MDTTELIKKAIMVNRLLECRLEGKVFRYEPYALIETEKGEQVLVFCCEEHIIKAVPIDWFTEMEMTEETFLPRRYNAYTGFRNWCIRHKFFYSIKFDAATLVAD